MRAHHRLRTDGMEGWLRAEGWYLAALLALLAFHGLSNWLWLSANVTILGWDRASHLQKSLIYYDLFRKINARTLFTALTWQQNRPPLPFITWALFYRLFGVSTDVALMGNFLFVAILLLSVYFIGRKLYNRPVGLLAAFFVSLFPILFCISRTSYVDYALTAMVALSLCLLVHVDGFRHRGFSILFGVSAGLGMFTKWPYIAFAGGPILCAVFRSGALRGVKSSLENWGAGSLLRRLLTSPLLHLILAFLLTSAWYWPNRDRASRLLLGPWLFILAWLLLGATFFALTRRPNPGSNLLSASTLGVTIACIWALPNIRFVSRFFYVAYSGVNLKGNSLDFLAPSTYIRYLEAMFREQLSPLYFLAFSIALLVLAAAYLREPQRKKMGEGGWLLLWLLVPYLIYTFSRTMNPRFDIALLPPVALITARGLLELKGRLKVGLLSLFIIGGLIQFFILSYDAFAWVDDLVRVDIPGVGSFSLLAEGAHIIRPNSGITDSDYWVGPKILDFIGRERGERPVILGLLTRELQLNENTLGYLIYADHPGIELWEINQIKDDLPVYPRLFACDFLVMKDGSNHRVSRETQEVIQKMLGEEGDYFHQVFRLAQRYPLPNGDTVYLYQKVSYLDQEYDQEAYEELSRDLEEARRGDAIIVESPDQMEIFGRYYGGEATFYPLPRSQPLDEEEVERELEGVAARHRRIYALFWRETAVDPHRYVEGWLDRNGYPAKDAWYGPLRLVVYGVAPEAEGSKEPLQIRFGEAMALTGYQLIDEKADGILLLRLFWERVGDLATDYKVFVHLLADDGSLLAQHDGPPAGGWRWDEEIEDRHGVLLSGLPPGEYRLAVGVYDPESGERLPVSGGGDRVMDGAFLLGRVQVVGQ